MNYNDPLHRQHPSIGDPKHEGREGVQRVFLERLVPDVKGRGNGGPHGCTDQEWLPNTRLHYTTYRSSFVNPPSTRVKSARTVKVADQRLVLLGPLLPFCYTTFLSLRDLVHVSFREPP